MLLITACSFPSAVFHHNFFREQMRVPPGSCCAGDLHPRVHPVALRHAESRLADRLSRIPAPEPHLAADRSGYGLLTFTISQWITWENHLTSSTSSRSSSVVSNLHYPVTAGAVAYRSGLDGTVFQQLPSFLGGASAVLVIALPVLMLGGGAADGQIDASGPA